MFCEDARAVSSADFAAAMVAAARKLGLEGIFLRLVAAELPEESWPSLSTLSEDAERVLTVRAPHCCPGGCTGTAKHCLTALKIEETVSKKMGSPYTVQSVQVEGPFLLLRISPVV